MIEKCGMAEKRCPNVVKRSRDKLRAARHVLPLAAWSRATALDGERNRIWIMILRTIYMQKVQEDMKYDISESRGGGGQVGHTNSL